MLGDELADLRVDHFAVFATAEDPVVSNPWSGVVLTAGGGDTRTEGMRRFGLAAAGDLKNAVGASVNTAAVSNNEPASVGVTPVQAGSSSITPGQVSAPELTSVTLNKSTDAFGATTFSATYTFDKAIGTAAITAANSAKFHLYDADGFAFNGLNCAPVSTTSASNAAVTCTTFTPAGTTSQTVANTTLGTVDATAVTGTVAPNMNANPEGAAPATGGTGTPLAG